MDMTTSIRNYVLDNYLFTDDQTELNNNDSFLEKGIIDSTGVLEIVSFIEQEYNIQVKDEEMIPDNLDSVENIVKYIEHKQSSQ